MQTNCRSLSSLKMRSAKHIFIFISLSIPSVMFFCF
jgi:hypothetical protein